MYMCSPFCLAGVIFVVYCFGICVHVYTGFGLGEESGKGKGNAEDVILDLKCGIDGWWCCICRYLVEEVRV